MVGKRILILGLALSAMCAISFASPGGQVVLFRIDLTPGTEAASTAAMGHWPLFDMSGSMLLTSTDIAAGATFPGKAAKVFEGDISELRWVIVRRHADPAIVSGRALYASGDRYLVRLSDLPAGLAEKPESYWVKPVRAMAPLAVDSTIINPNLAYNPAIAAIVDQVDSTRVKAWVTTMQNFGTRYVTAGNHATVTAWVKTQFTDMGIADVRTDTCYSTTGHNVIATVPGLYDTVTLYIAGGHYDSYTTSNAPGADDNASGTVAALEYAKILSQTGNRPNSTVKFAAFDAEELGLYGSTYYSGRLAAAGAKVGCMLNFDMCGALDSAGKKNDSLFYSQHYPGSTAYAQLLIRMARLYGRYCDTNVVGKYGTGYLGQSDSYPFSQDGFPVAWMMERYESSVYHSSSDNISHMNFRYYTGNLRGALGFFATLAFHPAKVAGVTVAENGDGHMLALSWKRDGAANITGYKVYWSRTSGSYADFHAVAGSSDTVDTISGLMADSLYYVAVVGVNDQGQESVFLNEFQARPFSGVATTAFSDDFETGLGKWTRGHSGGTVDWDTTSGSYHSPGHSATDSRAGNYGNSVNSYLQVLNGINLTGYNHASLSWWERYSTESGYDYCNPEYSINGGAWTALVARYDGSRSSWTQRAADLTAFCPAATAFKFRFRFTSDGGVVDDGWYVDDVLLTGFVPATGIADLPGTGRGNVGLSLQCWPSPAEHTVHLRYVLAAPGPVMLAVYDITGRRVTTLCEGAQQPGSHGLAWDCVERDGRRVANGTYFFRLQAGGSTVVQKVTVIR